MKPTALLLALFSPILVAQKPSQPAPGGPALTSIDDFGHRLLAAVAEAAPGNVCVSPWSAAVVLGMVRAGAAGETAKQLDAALGLDDQPVPALATLARAATLGQPGNGKPRRDEKAPSELRIANALWVDQRATLRPAFVEVLRDDFAAPPRPVDFTATEEARRLVNAWVAEQTRERIRELLPPGLPTTDTRLVLVNCLYLDAPWAAPFPAHGTKPRAFTLEGGEVVDVPTMAHTESIGFAETDRLRVVALPFACNELRMVIAVPRAETSLAEAGDDLRANWSLLAAPPYRTVALELPRFTLTSAVELKDALQALGVRDLFDRRLADLSRMSEEELFAAAALQKTFVKVDERGAEAAAATGIVVAPTAAVREPEEPVVVRVDRPFLFAIVHARAGLLFLGQILDPR